MNSLISDFVHDALMRGVSREDIAQALQKGGWDAKEIRTALDAFVESPLPLPVPRKRVSSSPKEAFLFLMLYATLYTAAFAVGSVLFDLINLFFPQTGDAAMEHSISSLRYGLASTIVAFPIFIFMNGVITRESLRNPGQRIAPVRRWLTYLTLFLASVSIMSDLITLIVRFLAGDITPRFILKVAAVAILAGGAFVYYLRDLRHDEIAPSAELRPTRRGRLGSALLAMAVLAIVILGFWYAGSPMQARLLAQDAQRVRDLASISSRVEQYYLKKGALPPSLAACDISPDTFVEQKQDRVTGRPYEYLAVDATHFQVGAAFALPSEPDRITASWPYNRPENPGFWQHSAGPNTYTIDATRKDLKGH